MIHRLTSRCSSRLAVAPLACVLAFACPPAVHAAARSAADSSALGAVAPADSNAAPAAPDLHAAVHPPIALVARRLGLENVTVDPSSRPVAIAYENRRFRHTVDALGWIARGGDSLRVFERRLGMVAAAITPPAAGSSAPFRVRYPSDAHFPRAPHGSVQDPTSHTLEFTVGPLIAYDLGRVLAPAQFLIQTELMMRWNPWPGARTTTSIVFPNYDNFLTSPLHPDIDNVRPGLVTFEQYAWVPRVALTSASAGVFGDNRWGWSVGAARPLLDGALLLDAQADVTGFLAFNTTGIDYSGLANTSTAGSITWHPRGRDLSLRARVGQYLYGDRGEDFELKRSFGDLDVAFSLLKSKGLTIEGVRVTLPIPPMTRPTQLPIRVLPVATLPISFRTDATLVGQTVVGVASREDYLRQLSLPSLENNRYRWERAQGRGPDRDPAASPRLAIDQAGMTGFIVTPWAGVQPEGTAELAFTNVPKKWSYNPGRGVYHNEIYSGSIGILPRTEVALRITRTPGFNPFAGIDAESRISTDTDHMASFRVALLEPRDRHPGLAIGVDDIRGSRRYHSSYLVAGIPVSIFHVQNRFSLGYASPVFTASRHVLDGAFGAVEVSPWRAVAARFEYDTEKVNVGLGVDLGFGLQVRAAALNMESLSAGVGWQHRL